MAERLRIRRLVDQHIANMSSQLEASASVLSAQYAPTLVDNILRIATLYLHIVSVTQ